LPACSIPKAVATSITKTLPADGVLQTEALTGGMNPLKAVYDATL